MELPIEFRLIKIKNLYQIEYRPIDIFKYLPSVSNSDNKNNAEWNAISYYFLEDDRIKETTLKYRDVDGCCMFIKKHPNASDIELWCENMKCMLKQQLFNQKHVSEKDNELYEKYKIIEIIELKE